MLAMPSFSRLSRTFPALISIVLCGILLRGWYIWTTHFAWTRYGSFNAQHTAPSNKPTGASSNADSFPFPLKIWQTGPSLDLVSEVRPLVKSWQSKNPDFRYELLSDQGAELYVRDQFANRPEILDAYLDVRDVILRADLLRLLIMLASGGVYTDLDTRCLVPVIDWIPNEYYNKAQVVVGVEVDLFRDNVPMEERSTLQLCQWTLMAMPGSKHFEAIVVAIINRMRTVAKEKNIPLTALGDAISVPEVITTTGPRAFTKALLDSLSESLNQTIDTRDISGLKGPLLLDEILFLPVNAFAGHQMHSHSGEPELGPLLVEHFFRSSWWKAKDNRA